MNYREKREINFIKKTLDNKCNKYVNKKKLAKIMLENQKNQCLEDQCQGDYLDFYGPSNKISEDYNLGYW